MLVIINDMTDKRLVSKIQPIDGVDKSVKFSLQYSAKRDDKRINNFKQH